MAVPWNHLPKDSWEAYGGIPDEKWPFEQKLMWWDKRDIREEIDGLVGRYTSSVAEEEQWLEAVNQMYDGQKYEYALEYLKEKLA